MEISNSPALKHLVRFLNMGGKITKAPNEISIMLNGLRYYSIEVTVDEEFYYIQAFEEEAVKLYNNTMCLLANKILQKNRY
jgi:hypothetical protein